MDALNFVISVNGDGALREVQKLNVSFKGLFNMGQQLKTISLVNLAQGISNINSELQAGIAPGADYQQGLADLQAITGIAGEDLKSLGENARQVGIDSGLGASQAIEAYKLLASNIDVSVLGGVKGLKILQKETITLAQAAGVDLPTAANTMSFALNQFNYQVGESTRVVNALGAGAKYGAAEIPDLALSLKESGSVAAQANISIEGAIGAIEVLSQSGIKGAEAGTMFRNVLLKLQTEEIPGVNLKAQGLSASLAKLKGIVNDATAMEKIFGEGNIVAAQILIENAAAVQEMTNRVTGTTVAYEQAEIRTKSYKTELARIKAQMDDYTISIFESTSAFLPWIEIGGQAATTVSLMLPALQLGGSGILKMVGSLGGLVKGLKAAKTAQDAMYFAFTKSPWGAVISGIILLGGVLGALALRTKQVNREQTLLNEVNSKTIELAGRERVEFDRLFFALKRTNPATEERRKAIAAMNNKYPEYIKYMKLEKATAEDVAKSYSLVIAEMNKKAKAQAWDSIMTEQYAEIGRRTMAAAEQKSVNKKSQETINKLEEDLKKTRPSEQGPLVQAINTLKTKISLNEGAIKEETDAKRKLDQINTMRSADMMNNVASTTASGGGNKYNQEKEKKDAVTSISGDSHAIKNINITFDSLIRDQTIIMDNTNNTSEFQAKLSQALLRIVNDANLIAG